ncbi:MAG: hypothetical protein AAFR74_05165 [Pseudomonadota bacterium]
MPAALLLPLLLRAAGPIAFLIAAVTAGVMNQSFMIVPLLAIAATVTTIVIRKVSPSPASDLAAMLDPNAIPKEKSIFEGAGKRLGVGLVGYTVTFGIAALIAAMFQETEFNQTLTQTDAWIALIPSVLAIFAAMLSARLGANQIAGMAGQMADMFAAMKAQQGDPNGPAQDDDAFTVEGEIIDKDEKS